MQLYYFTTNLTSGEGAAVLTIAGGTPAVGSTLQTSPNTMQLSQFWLPTSTGQLLSACNSTLALSVGANNSLIVDTSQPGSEAQVWQFLYGVIVNPGTGQELSVATPSDPTDSAVTLVFEGDALAQQWTQTGCDCNSLLTTVINGTNTPLWLTARATGGRTFPQDASLAFPPGVGVTFLSTYGTGLAVSFEVWDLNYSETNSVASFDVHQHHCVFEGGDVWVDTINYVDGYGVADVQTETGSYSDSLPGNAQVTITRF